MDNIINRLSRQPEGRPETFKKFNPNPPPEPPAFPSYEQWVQQAQTAEKQEVQRPPEFPSYEDWQSQTTGGTLPSHFQMEAPTEIGMPTGEMPVELPTEEGIETGIPLEFQKLMDFLGLTNPNELVDIIGEATDKDLATLFRLAGVKEEEEIEEPLPLPIEEETREDYIKRLLKLGATHSEAGGMANLLYPEEEELKIGDTGYTVADFVSWALENNKLYKDVIEALVKAGLEPTKAKDSLNAYLSSTQIKLPLK